MILIACLLLTGCGGEKIDPAPQAGERHQLRIEWRVVDRPTLEQAYRDSGMVLLKRERAAGDPNPQRDRLHGFAGRLPDGSAVIYTLPPERLDDQATCTLGHEILHITHGDYHR